MSKLPANANTAHAADGAKLCAPSALRNMDAITEMVASVAPETGRALEIASGTGQHITAFARAVPQLVWHPTEIAPERIASINAYAAEAALPNLRPAQMLDATADGWASSHAHFDLIYLGNLLHLIPAPAAHTLLGQAARALAPRGVLILYGPFMRSGVLTSDGDRQFDADLRRADPAIGYKDDVWVNEVLTARGLRIKVDQMPANNLCIIARQEPS